MKPTVSSASSSCHSLSYSYWNLFCCDEYHHYCWYDDVFLAFFGILNDSVRMIFTMIVIIRFVVHYDYDKEHHHSDSCMNSLTFGNFVVLLLFLLLGLF